MNLHRREDHHEDCLNGQSHRGFDRRSICASRRNGNSFAANTASDPQVARHRRVGNSVRSDQDPDRSLPYAQAVGGEEWKTDEEAVLNVIVGADYIFAGHSHADHIADIPFIAKRFGAKVIGSRTTINLWLSTGVDKAQLTAISGGEKLDFKDFSAQVIESQHGVLKRGSQKRQPRSTEITSPLSGQILGKHFVEGGCYLYYFTSANSVCWTKAPATSSKRISTN